MLEAELDEVLGTRAMSAAPHRRGDSGGGRMSAVAAHGTSPRSLLGTFGKVEIAAPRDPAEHSRRQDHRMLRRQ